MARSSLSIVANDDDYNVYLVVDNFGRKGR
jgi:hypothetical protein